MGLVRQGSVWAMAALRVGIEGVARYPIAASSILGIAFILISHVGATHAAPSVKIDTGTQTVRGEAWRPARRSLHQIRYKSNRDLTAHAPEPVRSRY